MNEQTLYGIPGHMPVAATDAGASLVIPIADSEPTLVHPDHFNVGPVNVHGEPHQRAEEVSRVSVAPIDLHDAHATRADRQEAAA